VVDECRDQSAPLRVVLRRIGPPPGLIGAVLTRAALEGEVRLGLLRYEREWGERELDQWMVAGADDRVVRQVGDGEVVVRLAVRVLVVDVAAAPVRQAEPGAAVEDVVRADVVRRLCEATDGP
jgi:hypothetical protein